MENDQLLNEGEVRALVDGYSESDDPEYSEDERISSMEMSVRKGIDEVASSSGGRSANGKEGNDEGEDGEEVEEEIKEEENGEPKGHDMEESTTGKRTGTKIIGPGTVMKIGV